ncbi:MAG: phosphodiester glycosidase family protein [Bacteroidales bacterium]|nr:phosphodiester glycosidase family protein [Bacteroidales bacterium]
MRTHISAVSAMAWAVLITACGGKTDPAEALDTPLQVSPASQAVVSLGETKTFSVVSSTDWYARSSESWAKIQTASGKAGKTGSPLTVSCEENRTAEARTARITVSNLGKETLTVSLEQAAGDGETPAAQRGIATADDLVAFAKAVNGEGSVAPFLVDGVVKVLNDIDASSIKEWTPAGTEAMPLTYSINGNNCTIRNVNWTVDLEKSPMAGLVGCAKGITIQKLTFGDEGSKVSFTGNPSGKVRAGGIVGRAESITMEHVTNNAGLTVTGTSATGNDLIVGGIAGYINSGSKLGGDLKSQGCANNGDITVPVPAQQGGIVGYNSGIIKNCSNYGAITGRKESNYGPGWLCSYNSTKSNVTSNYGYGSVNGTPAMMKNAMVNYEAGYDLEANTVDWTLDAYYDWETVETRRLHSGATYTHYSCVNVPRHIHVLEIDLKDTGIELNSSLADERIPNPNGNGNSNNGFNKRETLSMLCNRRRAEGKKVLAGVNSCFFDSNDGISRGFHVEDGEPVYINNPSVVSNLTNHLWGFTVFADGTASCGKKAFTGTLRMGGKEYRFNTVNDTTLRHASPTVSPVNLFTSRYVRVPHPSYPSLINDLASNVLYVICEYTGDVMKVNTGYAAAKVVDIVDGRSGSIEKPYITAGNRVGIALSGEKASEWYAKVKKGDTVELRCDIAIDGDASKPILALDSTMYQLLTDGEDASNTPGSSASLYSKYDPITFPVVSQDRSKVWLVEVDGRQDWYSTGIKGYELYRIAKKLGGWWATRLDGGGSSAMWVWDASKGSGALVNRVSDSKGERSCMSYLLLTEK